MLFFEISIKLYNSVKEIIRFYMISINFKINGNHIEFYIVYRYIKKYYYYFILFIDILYYIIMKIH